MKLLVQNLGNDSEAHSLNTTDVERYKFQYQQALLCGTYLEVVGDP